MQKKFGVSSPTIIDFLRSKLVFPFEVDKQDNKKPKYYRGYVIKDGEVTAATGKEETSFTINSELVDMQRVLDQLSVAPKPSE